MRRALITGITGFVGSHLAEFLLEKEVEVFGSYRWRSPKLNIEHIIGRINLVNCELLDASSVMNCIKKVKPDVIFHLAAQSYVPVSFDEPAVTLETNIIGTLNILEAVRKLKLDPIIHICSSSEVYGDVKVDEIPIKETNHFKPASPYAVSKVGEDMISLQYFLSYGIKTIRSRMFTHTGPRRGEVFVVSAFAKQIAAIELGLKEPIIKVGNLESIRTFMDVRDAVNAYWLLVKYCKPGEVYNIGGDRTMKIGEMLDLLLELSPMKDKIKIEVDPDLLRPSDVSLQIPCIDKFVKETNWKAKIPFEKTLKDILDYWRSYLKIKSSSEN
ncbi:MAG: GDP-mannose 4,6-dehydratase [Promethearchaeota archaeon]